MPDFIFTGPGGRQLTVTGPEGATREQAIDILRQQHPEIWRQPDDRYAEEKEGSTAGTFGIDWRGAGRTAKGVAKTAAGLGAGAAELAHLGDTGPVRAMRDWSKQPAESVAEEIGGVLPYFSPTGELGLLAKTALGSGIGFLQPTGSNDWGGHFGNAALGGAGTAALHGAGRIASSMPRIPFHYPHFGWHFTPLGWLGALAARGTAMAGQRGVSAAAGSRPVQAVRRTVATGPGVVGTTFRQVGKSDDAQEGN